MKPQERLKLAEGLGRAIGVLPKWLAVYGIARLASDAFEKAVDRVALVQVLDSFNHGANFSPWINLTVLVVGIGGIMYGYMCDRERKATIKQFAPQVARLEGQRDPGRSSTNLLGDGETNPSDD